MALIKQWNGSAWVEVAAQTPVPIIDTTPHNGATTAGISSDWAYQHNASSTAHGLGSAATHAATDFATAAQGAKADAPLTGLSDIGEALADGDAIGVYNTSASGYAWSIMSRFWTYIASKLSAYTGDLTAKSFSLNQNISQAAWTTGGVRHKNSAVTLTDTSSSGTVAAAYTNVFGGNTIAASNATTFTEYATTYLSAPVAGTNVTITNPYALSIAGNTKLAGGTVTASAPVLDIAQTWNNSGVAFTGIKANFTSTASSSSSLLVDLQADGTSALKLFKSGTLVAPYLYVATNYGVYKGGAGNTALALTASSGNWFFDPTDTTIGFSASQDLKICRDAADVFAQRRSTTAQTFRVYNTYTDASNYERAKIEWASNVLKIGTERAGTGTARALELVTDGTTQVSIGTSGAVTCTSTLSATTLTASASTANTSVMAATGYSLTGSSAVAAIDVAGTWNTSGTPTLCKYALTDTASNAASLLIDYQVGGVSQYRVRKDGALNAKTAVSPVTSTAAPTAADSWTLYTNEGDADGATITLPTAAAGLWYEFYVQTAQTMTVTANTGDTIRIGSSVTASAGSITSAVVGSFVRLKAINATEWVAASVVGSWSV